MIHTNNNFLERIKISTVMFPFIDEKGYHDGIMRVEIMNNLDKINFAQQVSADLDFIIYKNTNFTSAFIYKSESGAPYDLTGCTVEMEAKHAEYNNLQFKINTKINESVKGKIDVFLSQDEIMNIPLVKGNDTYYNYTLTINTPNGKTYRILQGIIKIEV